MGPCAGLNETNGAQIGSASAEKTKVLLHTHTHTYIRTNICSFFDPESIGIHEGI